MELQRFKKELRKIENLWQIVLKTNYLRGCFAMPDLPDEFEKGNDDFNLFSNALVYFEDLLDVVFQDYTPIENATNNVSFTRMFSLQISFLQAVFVQQDLIREMFWILNLDSDFEESIKNTDFKQLREIRNKLIGHPISIDGRGNNKKVNSVAIISSSNKNPGVIEFARYEHSNNFKIELKDHINADGKKKRKPKDYYEITDLQSKHWGILKKSIEIMTSKLDTVFRDYLIALAVLKSELSIEVESKDFRLEKIRELVHELGVEDESTHFLFFNKEVSQEEISRLEKRVINRIRDHSSTLEDSVGVSDLKSDEKPLFDDLG